MPAIPDEINESEKGALFMLEMCIEDLLRLQAEQRKEKTKFLDLM